MSYLPITLLAYLLNSIAVTVDKFLLSKTIPDPLIYIFYFSLISFFVVFALPFTNIPTARVFLEASISTIFWTLGAYLMFWALKSGQVQRVIPVIGTLTPLILLILSSQTDPLTSSQQVAIVLLISGLIFLTLGDWQGRLGLKEILLESFSALFFALSYLFLRLAFLKEDFLTVLVWSKPVLIPLAIFILIIPALRIKITQFTQNSSSAIKKSIPLFVFGQISAGISEVLLAFSVSLTSPAIVNSLQGVKYVFLVILSLILGKKFPAIFKNSLSGRFFLSQILGIGLIGAGLYLLTNP